MVREYIHRLAEDTRQIQPSHTNRYFFDYCTELCNQRMYEVCALRRNSKSSSRRGPGGFHLRRRAGIDENRETIRRVVHRLGRRDTSRTTMGPSHDQIIGLEFRSASSNI